jgi:hypothetical protein
VLLGALALGKVAGFCVQRGRVGAVLLPARSGRDPNGLNRCLGEARKAAETLKQDNLFVKAPPKEQPVKQVEGILGAEALIGGKWYKVGDKIADAKIVAIAATQVEVEWDGKKTSFSPIASASARPPGPPSVAAGPRKEGGPPPVKPVEIPVSKVQTQPPTGDDPLAWIGVKLSPRLQAMFLEKWNKASPEEREKGKEQWNRMSDEEKQKAVDSMEARV